MNADPRTRSGLHWSFQSKEFIINHNDVKPFSEVIKIETEFLTTGCGAGVPIFFQKYQIRKCTSARKCTSTRGNVQVLEEQLMACFTIL